METCKVADAIFKLDLPAVDLAGLLPGLSFPLIATDHEAVATLAFQHFVERGFQRYAFCGFEGQDYSDQRLQVLFEAGRKRRF